MTEHGQGAVLLSDPVSSDHPFYRLANIARSCQCFHRGVHHLGGPRLLTFILRLRLDEFGVRQDDAELVVQRMKQLSQLGRVDTHLLAS
ncbi:MAG: hypothetical protein HGA44_14910 [Cellulomonadaceae bacterium]|nr:hypothetical protein [Cellulomonadaceae bacterium]